MYDFLDVTYSFNVYKETNVRPSYSNFVPNDEFTAKEYIYNMDVKI